jgi:hypothetical protein
MESRGAGERQTGRSYCGCSRSRLGCSRSENRTTERGHRVLSRGITDRTAPGMERHHRPQPHVQSRLIQEVLQRLGVSKARTRTLHLESDGMFERYMKMVEEHLLKVVVSHQRNWDARLPILFLAYRESTHDTTGLTPATLVFGRELRLPYDLLFGAPPRQGTTHNQPCGKFCGPSIRHPHLCPPTPEAAQWTDENSLRQTGQPRVLPQGWQCVAVSANPHEGEIAQVPILMGGPIYNSDQDKWYGVQNRGEP